MPSRFLLQKILIIHKKDDIDPAKLHPMDSTEIAMPYGVDGETAPVQKYRDGPMTLHEMFEVQDTKILSMVADYRINLLSSASMSDEEINRFVTSLREVMLCAKYRKDKARLNYMVQNDAGFKNVDRKTVEVINAVVGKKFKVKEGEETLDMSEALRGIIEDAKQEGMQEGIQLGEWQGIREIARKMLMRGKYSHEEIAEETSLSSAEVQALAAELGV